MNKASKTDEKMDASIQFRHYPSVEKFALDQAEKEERDPSAAYRRIFNAGLSKLYGVKFTKNKIVKR